MLVLTRKIGEVVTIGDPLSGQPPVEITLLSVRGEIVEIGVTAPAGVRVEITATASMRQRHGKREASPGSDLV